MVPMDKKTLLLLILGGLIALILGFGGIWLATGGGASSKEDRQAKKEAAAAAKAEKEAKEEALLTATFDMFQLTLPCQRDANGNTPIVHADLQLVVPIKHRLKVEQQASRVRDIIATYLRNHDVAAINKDMEGFKRDIIAQAKSDLDVEISEILVLRFDYDILRARP